MKKITNNINVNQKNIKKVLDNFGGKRIAVIGDIMLDEYYWGKVSRISPEAPVPVVKYNSKTDILGGATNVANNIVTLGGNPLLIAVLGNDNYGETLLSLIKSRGISTEGIIKDPLRPTTVKTRIMAHNQQMLRIDREETSPTDENITKEILKVIQKNIDNIDAVLISDYAKGVITESLLSKLIPFLNKHKKFIAVDPQIKHFLNYKKVSILTPNNKEASEGIGIEINNEESLINAAEKILKTLKSESLLITQGEDGMTLFEKNGKYTHIPTVAKQVYDVTGAGDTVISTYILSVCSGATLLEAAYISNHAAGVVVGQLGTSAITLTQLKEALGIS